MCSLFCSARPERPLVAVWGRDRLTHVLPVKTRSSLLPRAAVPRAAVPCSWQCGTREAAVPGGPHRLVRRRAWCPSGRQPDSAIGGKKRTLLRTRAGTVASSIDSAQLPSCLYDRGFGLRPLCQHFLCNSPRFGPFFSRFLTNRCATRDSRNLETTFLPVC